MITIWNQGPWGSVYYGFAPLSHDALNAYSHAIRINPYISEVWLDLGSLYEGCNNQILDAIYSRASELNPSNHVISQHLQNVQTTGGQLPAAPGPQYVHILSAQTLSRLLMQHPTTYLSLSMDSWRVVELLEVHIHAITRVESASPNILSSLSPVLTLVQAALTHLPLTRKCGSRLVTGPIHSWYFTILFFSLMIRFIVQLATGEPCRWSCRFRIFHWLWHWHTAVVYIELYCSTSHNACRLH